MTMPLDLVLVRHGESEGNVATNRSKLGDHSAYTPEFKMRHSSSWRLTDRGVEQARMAGAWIREHIGPYFDRYYTSEYLRAIETAAHLGLPDAVWFREFYLRERDWGELDRISFQERSERFAEAIERRTADGFYWRPPNGESMADLCLRIDRLINTLHRETGDRRVIIVCHGEVMWAFRVRLERMPQRRFHELDRSKDPVHRIHNCQILHYTRIDPETGRIASHHNWKRSVCPSDTSLSTNEWEAIVRRHDTNEDLLAEAALTERQISE